MDKRNSIDRETQYTFTDFTGRYKVRAKQDHRQRWESESGIVGWDVAIRIGKFPIQTPLDARPGLGTQPHYEAPGGIKVQLYIRSD